MKTSNSKETISLFDLKPKVCALLVSTLEEEARNAFEKIGNSKT